MNKLILISLIGLITTRNANAQGAFVKHSLLEGKVQISLPSNYKAVAKSQIQKEFPDPENSPSVIYRELGDGGSLKIVLENNQVAANEVGQFKSWRISRMLKDSTFKVISHDLKVINGIKVGIIKVDIPQYQRYHHYFFTSLEGQLILLILECASDEVSKKNLEFDKIMSSLSIK